jgi:hypothetical protein
VRLSVYEERFSFVDLFTIIIIIIIIIIIMSSCSSSSSSSTLTKVPGLSRG